MAFRFLYLLMALLLIGCAQPDGPYGSAVGPSIDAQMGSAQFYALRDTSFGYPLGASDRLYVGEAYGLSSELLIRFNPTSLDSSVVIDSARIVLNYGGGIGEGDGEYHFQAQLLHFSWSTPPDPAKLPVGTMIEPQVQELAPDTGRVIIPVPVDVVMRWLRWEASADSSQDVGSTGDPSQISGAFLTLRLYALHTHNRLVRFNSGEVDSLRPQMLMFHPSQEVIDSVVVDSAVSYPAARLSLISNGDLSTADKLVIGDGALFLSMMQFDVTDLSETLRESNIIVNRATVTLYRDGSYQSWGAFKSTLSLKVQKLRDSSWVNDLEGWKENPTYAGYPYNSATVDSSADSVQIVITDPVVGWVADSTANFGLLIQSYNALFYSYRSGLDIERIAFHSTRASDPLLRPKLTVHYTEVGR